MMMMMTMTMLLLAMMMMMLVMRIALLINTKLINCAIQVNYHVASAGSPIKGPLIDHHHQHQQQQQLASSA